MLLLYVSTRSWSQPSHKPSSTALIVCSKESHITTFVHLLLASGLPFTNLRIPELDYCSHVTIELWEKTSAKDAKQSKDFSIRLSISEGAHSPAVLDSNVDAVSGLYFVARTMPRGDTETPLGEIPIWWSWRGAENARLYIRCTHTVMATPCQAPPLHKMWGKGTCWPLAVGAVETWEGRFRKPPHGARHPPTGGNRIRP